MDDLYLPKKVSLEYYDLRVEFYKVTSIKDRPVAVGQSALKIRAASHSAAASKKSLTIQLYRDVNKSPIKLKAHTSLGEELVTAL
jgi:hypothetical protein